MFNTELTTYKTGGGTLSDKSMHPGEYGRVSAWIKKLKNDLVLNKDIYGQPPSTVFESRPATQYMGVRAIDPGDMEGHSRFDCINAQRQLDVKYYEEEKRNRQPPPRTSQPELEVKRLKAASDNNREQNKSQISRTQRQR
jgi:hypothetical protein